MKINVVGTSASGKSTFGKALASAKGVPYIEMDALFWRPNWSEPPDDEFFNALQAAIAIPSWVLDGNYTRTIPIKWKEVDTVIWLDYSFTRTLFQSITRALHRSWSQVELWPNTGNHETFGKLFSKDSIVLWCLRGYPKNRRKYIEAMNHPDYAHIEFVRLASPRAAAVYLSEVASNNGSDL